jgi:hypothetical protein
MSKTQNNLFLKELKDLLKFDNFGKLDEWERKSKENPLFALNVNWNNGIIGSSVKGSDTVKQFIEEYSVPLTDLFNHKSTKNLQGLIKSVVEDGCSNVKNYLSEMKEISKRKKSLEFSCEVLQNELFDLICDCVKESSELAKEKKEKEKIQRRKKTKTNTKAKREEGDFSYQPPWANDW